MKKFILFFCLILLAFALLVGCGSDGGGSTPASGKVTTNFHVRDQSSNPIVGVSFLYTNPSGQACVSPQTDSNGNMTIVTTVVGAYSGYGLKHGSTTYSITPTLQFYTSQVDLDNNRTYNYTITINIVTGVITIT